MEMSGAFSLTRELWRGWENTFMACTMEFQDKTQGSLPAGWEGNSLVTCTTKGVLEGGIIFIRGSESTLLTTCVTGGKVLVTPSHTACTNGCLRVVFLCWSVNSKQNQ